jgi:hypothetical protein
MKRLVQQVRRKYFVKPSESTRTKRHEDLKKETSFGYIYTWKDYRMRGTQSSSHVVMDLSRVSSTSTTTHTSSTSFFQIGGEAPASASIDAYGFFIVLFYKGLTKTIHYNTRSHHTTPTAETMREDHANRA